MKQNSANSADDALQARLRQSVRASRTRPRSVSTNTSPPRRHASTPAQLLYGATAIHSGSLHSYISPGRRHRASMMDGTTPPRRISAMYEATHWHEGGTEDGTNNEAATATEAANNVLDLHTAAMRRASRELMSATNMRSRQLVVDLQYHPHPQSSSSLEEVILDEDVLPESGKTPEWDPHDPAPTLHLSSTEEAEEMTSDRVHSENLPLLPSLRPSQAETSPSTATSIHKSSSISDLFSNVIQQTSAVAVVALLNIMISIPFGASYFPIGWKADDGVPADSNTNDTEDEDDVHGVFPMPGKQALGIRMFLFATIMGQLAFTFFSKFENPVGLQMVENVPFLHALCHTVIQQQGYGMETLSTVFFLFALSSVVVGLTFYCLGRWKLGRLVYFFPNHVLVGCIGGIGVFMVITAMEVTSDTTFSFDLDGIQGLMDHWDLVSVVLGFEAVLRCLQYATQDKHGNAKYPLLSPVYYCMITPVLYCGLWIWGMTVQEASERGFFFPALDNDSESTASIFQDPHLWDIFTLVDLRTLSWSAIFQSTGTMIALAAFSLIHVPINIPAFAISTDVDTDMNQELIAHGYANLFSGVFGGLQTYMTYSNSVLYAKSGGKGKLSSLAIVALTMALFVIGPSIASYLPRSMAGTLLLHIGIDLVLEGVYDSFGQYDHLEYAGIWAITLVMTIWGMTAALIAGIIAALTTYAVQSINYQNPIRQVMTASTLRSSAWARCIKSRNILESDETGRARILVFQLQGHLFFGNVAQLTDTIKYVLTERNSIGHSPIVVIVDFTLVMGMDSSAAHAVAKLKKILHRLFHVKIALFVTGSGRGGFPCEFALSDALTTSHPMTHQATSSGTSNSFREVEKATLSPGSLSIMATNTVNPLLDGRVFESLDDALRFAEDILIARVDSSLEVFTTTKSAAAPQSGAAKALLAHEDEMHLARSYLRELLPTRADAIDRVTQRLLDSMTRQVFQKDEALWEAGQESDSLKLLIHGELESIIEDTGASERVSPGNIVGELGLVHGTRRLTTLFCSSNTAVLYCLNRTDFENLQQRYPQVASAIDGVTIRYLAHRVQHVNNRYFHTTLPV